MEKIERDAILICTIAQKTGCGILYVRENSIIKAAETAYDDYGWIDIYRNKREEANDKTHAILMDHVREATPEEAQMWEDGINYINQVTEKADAATAE